MRIAATEHVILIRFLHGKEPSLKLAPLPMSGFVAQLITAPIERIKIPSRPEFFQAFFLQLRKLQLTCKDECVTWSTQ